MKIIIDPGHGGKDPGGGSNSFWKEKDKVLDISLYQYKRYKELGIEVQITRDKDVYLSPELRTTIVKNSKADICISNHLNAFNGKIKGAETIHSIYSDGRLANLIMDELVAVGAVKRRVFSKGSEKYPNKDYYFMHRETGNVETIIVEYGFADNSEDAQRILNNWQAYAEAVVKATCIYLNHPYDEKEVINWKYEGIDYLHENEILDDYEGWKAKIDEPMPVWAVAILLSKMHKKFTEK